MCALKALGAGLIALAAVLSGCAGAHSPYRTAETAEYREGELRVTYAASFERTIEASRAALQYLDMNIERMQRDGAEGTINAVTKDGRAILLSVRAEEAAVTSVHISVEGLGDEELSRALSRRIQLRLDA